MEYTGKPESQYAWYRKVERRTTQTLKFLNSARILRIIGYDPTQYMSLSKFNEHRTILNRKETLKPMHTLHNI